MQARGSNMATERAKARSGIQLSLFGGAARDRSMESPAVRREYAPPPSPGGDDLESCVWTERERATWSPPEERRVSKWAEKHRFLPMGRSASPGPWSNKAYYTVEIMDSLNDEFVERITIMASVQSSKTESVYNMLGYAICEDPAPALVCMPTLATLRRVNKRIEMMIKESPEMSKHLTGDPDDLTRTELRLRNMIIYFATAGSSSDLRNVEARYILLDETDEYQAGAGEQGSPIEMAEARATTYWNRKIITCCTPTTEDGYINIEYQRSDKRKCWVPCPHCGGYQVLSFWRVKHRGCELGKWPKEKRDPEYITTNRVARYECEHCGEEIDDRHKAWMLRFCTWLPEGHHIEKDGTCAIPRPRNSHVGYHWSALYSPWRTFSDVASRFFSTKDDTEKYKTFVNLWLGEPWKEVVRHRESTEILALRNELTMLVVPPWTIALTAGIDNQRYGKWIVIRAWGRDLKSHLVRHGFVESFEEIEQWIFNDVYPMEGSDIVLPVWRAGIDIGGGLGEDPEDDTMTEQVYDWIRRSGRGVVFGTKGLSRSLEGGKKMRLSDIDTRPTAGRRPKLNRQGVRLWLLDTGRIKDAVWSRIESGKFHLNSDVDEAYARHLTAEGKEKGKDGRYTWKVQGTRANHQLDCEVIAAAMADPECYGGVTVLKAVQGFSSLDGRSPMVSQERPRVVRSKWMGGLS